MNTESHTTESQIVVSTLTVSTIAVSAGAVVLSVEHDEQDVNTMLDTNPHNIKVNKNFLIFVIVYLVNNSKNVSIAVRTGLEPVTSTVTVWHSNQI